MEPIEISEYNPLWPDQFAQIAGRVRTAFRDGPLIAVEHVGSTSVAGLAAKPIIDIVVIVPSRSDVPNAIVRLATLGYVHQGDLGVTGREAFRSPPDPVVHHLYLCVCDNAEYCHQVTFRDHLRQHSEEARRYELLKRDLAAQFPADRTAYSAGKDAFVADALAKAHRV